jgi:hypothetical protein
MKQSPTGRLSKGVDLASCQAGLLRQIIPPFSTDDCILWLAFVQKKIREIFRNLRQSTRDVRTAPLRLHVPGTTTKGVPPEGYVATRLTNACRSSDSEPNSTGWQPQARLGDATSLKVFGLYVFIDSQAFKP